MPNIFKPKSEFARNVITLMTGTTVAQAIPIGISPILTRIYSPEDFGVFALFVAIVSIFGSVANGRYELAIMLPRKDDDAINIVALGLVITIFLSLLLFILAALFNEKLTHFLNNQEIGLWLYFVPIAVFFTGLFNVLNFYNNRKKNYKDIANATILKSVALMVVQLGVGFFKAGAAGLVSGQILSTMFANLRLLKNMLKGKELSSVISKVKIYALAKRYRNFPKYTLFATFANTSSQYLINILVSSFFTVITLGYYSLVQRVLGIPSVIIGKSVGQVYFQTAMKEKHDTGRAVKTFKETVKKLTFLGLPAFVILFFIVEDAFTLVFGSEWLIAGKYAQILIPMIFIRFVFSPVSVIFIIFEKQRLALILQLGLMLTSLGAILLISVFDLDFTGFLFVYNWLLFVYYIIFLTVAGMVSKGV
jgi:O-antigen/teichoic acid export membrane protein